MMKPAQDSRGGKYTHSLLFLSTRKIRGIPLPEKSQIVSCTYFIGIRQIQMQIPAYADTEALLHHVSCKRNPSSLMPHPLRLFQHDPDIADMKLRKFFLYPADNLLLL
jgi:hypothetical protein